MSLIRDNQPIFFALMGDRTVFQRFKARIRERQTGLVAVFKAASDYVRAEQGFARELVRTVVQGLAPEHPA